MNMFEAYSLAKVQQEALSRRLYLQANQKEIAEAILEERAQERQFRLMYRVRHWLHRLAPRMARVML